MNHEVKISRRGLALLLVVAAALVTPQSNATPMTPRAGSWKTWTIASGAEYSLLSPPESTATKEEIKELLALQAQRSPNAQDVIRYWDTGSPSYRWNQLSFKIAAESSTSVVTERMLALLNVAIYDAMVSAWHSKYKHNRVRPHKFDGKITPAVMSFDSPSFPSEHAVAAGAASAVLSYLFPDKAEFLAAKAEECGRSRLMAGVHYPSDVSAGLRLGRQIAAVVVKRARDDGSDAKWTGVVPTKPGLWNGKDPAEPQMASWKTWTLSTGSQLRPGPPPTFDGEAMAEVREAAKDPRAKREAYFWAITSLPKFWNELLALKLFESRLDANPPLAARAYAILSTAYYDSLIACWDAKYAYWGVRPFQFDPDFKPLITTPNFPGYPSGHAMLSGTAAAVLAHLFPADSDLFNKHAGDAAVSRLLAGVHFRVDNDKGLELGRAVAVVAIERARKDGAE